VYLSDVSVSGSIKNDQFSQLAWEPAFQKSRWFTRGWTLQELIAPASVEFFSVEGERLGDKKSLERQIHEITGIPAQALEGGPLSQFNVNERMSWATKRETNREEDAAYSLLGIFDIHMPLIYGEGRKNALVRLYKEIKESLKDKSPALPPALFSNRRKSNATISTDKSSVARSIIRRETRDQDLPESPGGPIGLSTLYDPGEEVVVDLIFVHGLNGGSHSTWTKNGDVSLFWPREWLPKDEAFRDVRIHTFGYASGVSRESVLNIPDFARSLLYSIHDSPSISRRKKVSVLR
jgi:hypothetical protein